MANESETGVSKNGVKTAQKADPVGVPVPPDCSIRPSTTRTKAMEQALSRPESMVSKSMAHQVR